MNIEQFEANNGELLCHFKLHLTEIKELIG